MKISRRMVTSFAALTLTAGCNGEAVANDIPEALYRQAMEAYDHEPQVHVRAIGNAACADFEGEFEFQGDRFFISTVEGPVQSGERMVDALYFATTEGPITASRPDGFNIDYEIAVQNIPGPQVNTITECVEHSGGAILSILTAEGS